MVTREGERDGSEVLCLILSALSVGRPFAEVGADRPACKDHICMSVEFALSICIIRAAANENQQHTEVMSLQNFQRTLCLDMKRPISRVPVSESFNLHLGGKRLRQRQRVG